MGGFLGALGMQVASNAIDTGFGLALQGHNDRRQIKQQGRLLNQQLETDQEKMRYQKELDYQFWKDTNYKEQVKQMKEAGLSVGNIYGGSGAGGAITGGSSGGVSAASAPQGGGEIMGMQLMNAQRALIEAQTEKTKVETAKTAGVDTQKVTTEIQSLTQGINNAKATEALTRVQTNIQEIEKDLKTDSYEDVLNTIRYTWRNAEKQLEALEIQNEINAATKEERKKIVEAELIGLGLANELRKVETQLTEEQIGQIKANVAQGWKNLEIQEQNAITNLANSETAKKNADTSIKEFEERARNNFYGNTIAKDALALQKFLQNTPESTKLTVGAITEFVKAIFRK